MPEAPNRPRACARLNLLVCACAALALAAAAPRVARAQTQPAPVLFLQPNSLRAVALDSVTLKAEPFSPTAMLPWMSPDKRTRVMLFATNLQGAVAADLLVEAEDGAGRRHILTVESVGLVPELAPQNVSQVIVKLVDGLDNVGDVLMKIIYRGATSNRGRVGMGFVGGGPPDEAIRITGRVMLGNNAGLAGSILTLSGAVNALTATDAAGNYSFSNLVPAGDYTVTVSKTNYAFAPQSRTITGLLGGAQADFVASLLNYRINGRITEAGQPLAGIVVNLGGSRTATATTDAAGNYSFTAPAEGNYLVTPNSPLFVFSPSSIAIHNLSADQTQNFASTSSRPTYSVSGFVKQADQSPLGGALVTLSGPRSYGAVTDASGFYAIANVLSGDSYVLTVSKEHYAFTPAAVSLPTLAENKTADFTGALKTYAIAGRITNGDGAGVGGVTVTLRGSQSAAGETDANGNYFFTVLAGGDYTVTPTSQFNSFSPAIFAVGHLSGSQTANFNAVDLDGFYVLEFDGSPQAVDYGEFFHPPPGETQLGKFFWEVWAMPGTNAHARYMISDGFGGAHALLLGFIGDTNGTRYSIYGNVWKGNNSVAEFGSDDGPAPNEWGHYAVGWNGEYIFTYFNGVPVGLTPFAGPRMPGGSDNGAGKLFIGGSDHNNFMGRIAQVRGFEGTNPRQQLPSATFRPDLVFGRAPGISSSPQSTFLTNFFRPGMTVPDLAGGLVGLVRGTGNTAPNPMQSYPLPKFVIDPSAPTTSPALPPVAPAVLVDAPAPVPEKALVFDSFSRKNATYAFGGRGGLGSTEGGTAGSKEWKTAIVTGGTPFGNEAFGLLNGRAVALSDWPPGCVAWVEPGNDTGIQVVRVTRKPGAYKTGLDTSIAFRVVNSGNFFFAYTYGDPLTPTARKLAVGYWHELRRTDIVRNISMPENWTRLQVVTTSAGRIEVYANDILVYSTNQTLLANATGAGLWNNSHDHAMGNRWDDFTIFNLP